MSNPFWQGVSVGIGLLVACACPVRAEEQSVAQPQAAVATPPAEDWLAPVDASREYLSSKLVSYAREIDRFFGGDRNFQEANKSVVQLNLVRDMGQLGDNRNVLSGRAKLDLPTTQKRLHLMIESDPDKNVTGADTQGLTKPGTPTTSTSTGGAATGTTTPDSYSAALRYEQPQREQQPKHWSADAGLQFSGIYTRPFARLRGSYAYLLGQWRVKAAESVFWFVRTGVGETTQFDLERTISESKLFRATTSATWLLDTRNFDLRQDLTVFHTLDENNALLYQGSAIGVSRPAVRATDYVLLMQYRHQFRRKWIFFEISPQLHFPEDVGYRRRTLLTMRLLVNFDESQ